MTAFVAFVASYLTVDADSAIFEWVA